MEKERLLCRIPDVVHDRFPFVPLIRYRYRERPQPGRRNRIVTRFHRPRIPFLPQRFPDEARVGKPDTLVFRIRLRQFRKPLAFPYFSAEMAGFRDFFIGVGRDPDLRIRTGFYHFADCHCNCVLSQNEVEPHPDFAVFPACRSCRNLVVRRLEQGISISGFVRSRLDLRVLYFDVR